MKRFSCNTRIYEGPGSVARLEKWQGQRLMLVTDPYFVQNGTAQRLVNLSRASESCVFDKIQPDPTVELAAEGTAMAREFHPDVVVALGGGSTMDCAKAIVYFAGQALPLVAIPTTSGSGSEVTDFAVLTHKETKYPLVDARLRPAVAILDSELLKELPKSLVADTGFDVLGHALEGFTATNATPITDALAKEAFATVFAKLPLSFAGDTGVRGQIHTASTMAGLAFTHAGLGVCHALAHSLGALYHIPHGRLIAMLLPTVMECNAHVCGHKYAVLARSVGLVGSADAVAVRNLKNGLIRLRKELNMPQTLKEAGVDPRQVWHNTEQIVSTALKDPCCETNPLPMEAFMVRKILEAVTGRG